MSEETMIVSCAGVFISPELIKTVKMCRLHRDMFRINGNSVPSSANADSWRCLIKRI
jgi:hypothetical protein